MLFGQLRVVCARCTIWRLVTTARVYLPFPACISARVLGLPVKLRLRRGAVACA
jgi:hypothetical protein